MFKNYSGVDRTISLALKDSPTPSPFGEGDGCACGKPLATAEDKVLVQQNKKSEIEDR